MQQTAVKGRTPLGNQAHALVYAAPGRAVIDAVDLSALGPHMVEVETAFSGISRGTERLVFHGRVPESEWARMRAPMQAGDFPFPVRYGYAAVGRVTKGPEDLAGRHVFALHPHQTWFRVAAGSVVPVPDGVPPARAILGANMETALNAVWDARLSPGARCLVVGAGLLGWLVTILLSRLVGVSVHLTDVEPQTGVKADDFRVKFMTPDEVPAGAYDVAFHCAAAEAGLQTAIDALAFEGRVIELSWYGDRPVSVRLGGNFHASRLRIVSSQVGHVANPRRASTTHRDRLALALAALTDDRLDGLITTEVPFLDLPPRLPHVLADRAPGIATRIVY